MVTITILAEEDARRALPALVELLQDSVQHGASVGFLALLEEATAASFWSRMIDDLGRGGRLLWVARDGERIVGTAQLELCLKPNGLHRAEVQKVLVHSSARRRGIAMSLMNALEVEARAHHRTLLVLDTCYGSEAELLYQKCGFSISGIIPQFALFPDGRWCDTVIYYKLLGASNSPASQGMP
jgi:L-amino acid N-acyltransferase YncA